MRKMHRLPACCAVLLSAQLLFTAAFCPASFAAAMEQRASGTEASGIVQARGEDLAYDPNYPLEHTLDQFGLSYIDVAVPAGETQTLKRRLRQDGLYGLYNYFGLSEKLCGALYGEGVQSGTGEREADGDSLLVLGRVPLYQENTGSDSYKMERNGLALAIRDYLNSFSWQTESELYKAQYAAFYIAALCQYDMDLYDRFVQGGEEDWSDASFTAYGCLVNHRAVCQGMAVAYQLLTRAVGLKSFCAPDDDPNHMFVYVQADGNWYQVDLAVLNISPQELVNRCFRYTANRETEQMLEAFASTL